MDLMRYWCWKFPTPAYAQTHESHVWKQGLEPKRVADPPDPPSFHSGSSEHFNAPDPATSHGLGSLLKIRIEDDPSEVSKDKWLTIIQFGHPNSHIHSHCLSQQRMRSRSVIGFHDESPENS
jgi:hypothetical protein